MSEAKKIIGKIDGWTIATAAVVAFVLSPLSALTYAFTSQKIWTWFVAEQWGDGPTFQTWVGLGELFSLYMLASRITRSRDEHAKVTVTDTIAHVVVVNLLALAAILSAAWLRVFYG